MPDILFDTLDAVPEGLREHAKEANGKIVIDVVPNAKLKEFRDNNIALSQERDTLHATVGRLSTIVGDKPDDFVKEIETLRTMQRRVKDGELIENTSLDEAVSKRTGEMRAQHDGQVTALTQDRDAWKQKATDNDQKYRRTLIDRFITDSVLDPKSGARTDALPDLLQRAYSVFRVTDQGTVVPYDGDQIMYGGDGSKPMSGVEWLKKLSEQAPYFFNGSSGGGAGGNPSPGLGGAFSNEQVQQMSQEDFIRLRKEGKLR